MLTGDNRRTAVAVAAQLGISDVEAEVEPAGKVARIRKLHMEGKHPAMAGDGINDAPALSEAEVGIPETRTPSTRARCTGLIKARSTGPPLPIPRGTIPDWIVHRAIAWRRNASIFHDQ